MHVAYLSKCEHAVSDVRRGCNGDLVRVVVVLLDRKQFSMDTSLSGSKAHFEQRPLKNKYHLRITSSLVAMILRISGTYIPNDLSRIIEYLFILASCSGNFPFPESIERSGLAITLSASANQNVIINVARENLEDRTPCSPHKPTHSIGRNNNNSNNNRGHFYIPASPRRVSTKRFTRSTKKVYVKNS